MTSNSSVGAYSYPLPGQPRPHAVLQAGAQSYDRDTNVPVAHADLLADAIRAGGNADVTVRILPGHNHLFLEDHDGFFRR